MAKKEIKNMAENAEHEHLHSAEQQEKMIRSNMLEQDAGQIEQQLVMIEQQIAELQNLKIALGEIEKAKEKDEILASLGKNIFIRTALLSKDLLVNVGAKTAVKKTASEVQEIIDRDLIKISQVREQLAKEFERIVLEMQKLA